jgi:hypothetical protein
MAMNKSEKAEMEALRNALALSRAMRFPDYPVPQPMTYEEIRSSLTDGGLRFGSRQKVARGWFYNAHLGGHGPYSNRVTYGCSDGIHHSIDGDVTTSQGTGQMYRTREEASRALRHELTTKCAEVLAAVDRAIAAQEPTP